MHRLLNPRQILPLLIFFGVLTLGLRIDAVWNAAATGKLSFGAHAETKAEAPPAVSTPAPADARPAQSKPADAKSGDAKPADAKPAADVNVPQLPSPDASVADDASPAEAEVLKQLAERRDELEKRAHDLDMHDALIKVAEQRVDQKIKEMQSIRLQLQTMVDQINGAQQTQLENLVKIYETMKPADAAKIFEALDMPVLLGVIQRMKPKSTAPIMAAMKPEKAKEVTVALTKQDQLPPVK